MPKKGNAHRVGETPKAVATRVPHSLGINESLVARCQRIGLWVGTINDSLITESILPTGPDRPRLAPAGMDVTTKHSCYSIQPRIRLRRTRHNDISAVPHLMFCSCVCLRQTQGTRAAESMRMLGSLDYLMWLHETSRSRREGQQDDAGNGGSESLVVWRLPQAGT